MKPDIRVQHKDVAGKSCVVNVWTSERLVSGVKAQKAVHKRPWFQSIRNCQHNLG